MDNLQYTNCPECGAKTYYDLEQIGLRSNDIQHQSNGDLVINTEAEEILIMCPTCCKKKNWFNPICNLCSEFDHCSGEFKNKFKNWISGIRGV